MKIIGNEPEYINKSCDEVLMQQYYYNNILADEANVLYFKLEEKWISLCIDCGVVFWKDKIDKPEEWKDEENHFKYKIKYLTKEILSDHMEIMNIEYEKKEEEYIITIYFSNKSKLLLINYNDNTKYKIIK